MFARDSVSTQDALRMFASDSELDRSSLKEVSAPVGSDDPSLKLGIIHVAILRSSPPPPLCTVQTVQNGGGGAERRITMCMIPSLIM